MATLALSPEKTNPRLFYSTPEKTAALIQIGRHEILNVNQLVYLLHGELQGTALGVAQASTRRTLRRLKRDHLVHASFYRPPDFRGKGKYPLAYWLSKDGEAWVRDTDPSTDPKFHGADRSELNIVHDLRRTDFRIKLYEFAATQGAQIGQKKNGVFHLVKPDDLYEITKTKTARLFMESENDKKCFDELRDKLEPYVSLCGTDRFKKLWGFRYYIVLIPMRNERAVENVIVHLLGECNCIDPLHRRLHKDGPYKLISDHLWFTTHEAFLKNPAGRIFLTPAQKRHSLCDFIA